MKIKTILLVVVSIILVAFIHLNFIKESYTSTTLGIADPDGNTIVESKIIYHPPEVFGIQIQSGYMGLFYLIFIQSVPGIVLQVYILYTLLKIFLKNEGK